MKIRVQIIVESDNGIGEVVQEIAQFERGQLRPEQLEPRERFAQNPPKF